ncbi:MAG: PEGA domain-containing protein [Armatimonadetes bacterium]|nr:MAG: PEGA domain-containing protein [Armatimonadota bacterium]
MKKVVITTLIILSFILLGTTAAIFYARGYRIMPGNGQTRFEGTGLLVLTSKPDGARVFINDHLTTATDNTINLEPGSYDIKIEKDGYFTWHKKINVKKEVVSQTNALLFPIAPKLDSITITGADKPIIDNSGSLISYTTSSSSANKNGIYVLDMTTKQILPIQGSTTQIANDTIDQFSKAESLSFSPDSQDIIATIKGAYGTTNYLLSAKNFNNTPQDVTNTLFQIQKDWEKLNGIKDKKRAGSLPKPIQAITAANFNIISLSPDEDRILYQASQSASLPIVIKPRLPGFDSTPEQREIKKDNIYVYDIKEDKNYQIFNAQEFNGTKIPYLTWHPSSKHLFYIKDKKIHVVEYDGQNSTIIYAGPFTDSYVFPWPDGSSIVILTNLNTPNTPLNLYRVDLR